MLSEINSFLENAYDTLNGIYFGGSLPKVVITIMSTPKAYGHVTVSKTWAGSSENYRELNLGAEHLHRSIESLLGTLVHEMTHVYAMENNIADTSKGGKYHNKTFKKLCEERDLHIEYVKYIGYSKTEPTPAFVEKLKANGSYIDSFENYRLTGRMGNDDNGKKGGNSEGGGDTSEGDVEKKKKNYVRKYLCLGCGKSTRSTTDMNLGCLDCNMIMVNMSRQGGNENE